MYSAGANFNSVWSFIVNVFRWFFDMQSRIQIFGNFSLLDFNIAIIIFGIVFSVVFNVIRSGVNNSISSVDKHRAKDQRQKERDAHGKGK